MELTKEEKWLWKSGRDLYRVQSILICAQGETSRSSVVCLPYKTDLLDFIILRVSIAVCK